MKINERSYVTQNRTRHDYNILMKHLVRIFLHIRGKRNETKRYMKINKNECSNVIFYTFESNYHKLFCERKRIKII